MKTENSKLRLVHGQNNKIWCLGNSDPCNSDIPLAKNEESGETLPQTQAEILNRIKIVSTFRTGREEAAELCRLTTQLTPGPNSSTDGDVRCTYHAWGLNDCLHVCDNSRQATAVLLRKSRGTEFSARE
jgi:hypothetical protein